MNQLSKVIKNNKVRYRLNEVKDAAGMPDSIRKLYTATNEEGETHFKGFSISTARIYLENKRGNPVYKVFNVADNLIEEKLLEGDERNLEFVLNSDKNFIRELDDKGNYKVNFNSLN